jgi:hypothetical protein
MSVDTRATYHALHVLAGRYRSHPPARPRDGDLTPFELRVFSQNGEDGVIEEVLARIGTAGRAFVEFGVGGGVEGNCVFLADVLGWSGLFMESDPALHGALDAKYRHRPPVRTARARVGPENVDALLAAAGLPRELDVLSIDVDGIDLWIWRALSIASPRLVVIEYNASLDPGAALTQPLEPAMDWDGTDYFGASLGALRRVAGEKGYRLVHTDVTGVNAFFVREDLAAPFPPEDEVPVRAPNYFFSGHGHPAHAGGRRYVELSV